MTMNKVLCNCWPACGCEDACEARVETRPKFFTVERVLGILVALAGSGAALPVWWFHG